MKMLMIYCDKFGYLPTQKTVQEFPDENEGAVYKNILVGFIQAESQDEFDIQRVESKMIRNLKWAANKNNTRRILLHAFHHLSESKAEPEFTKKLLDLAQRRLTAADFETYQTPSGYILTLDIDTPARTYARTFKSIM